MAGCGKGAAPAVHVDFEPFWHAWAELPHFQWKLQRSLDALVALMLPNGMALGSRGAP